jgi:hypothetical protein
MNPAVSKSQLMNIALAWMRGGLTTKEVGTKLGIKQVSQITYTMGSALRAAWRAGLLK